MATLLQELLVITSQLENKGIEYAVWGGLAMAIHGFVRATLDIDVLIREESLEQAHQIIAKQGFSAKGLDMSFKEGAIKVRRISKIDKDGEDLSLDLLLVTPPLQDVWESRENLRLENRNLWFISRNGLVKMKQLAGTPKDSIDLEWLQNNETS